MGLICDHLSFPGKDEGTIGRLVYDVHHAPASYGLKAITDTSLQALHIAAHLDEIERRILPALREGHWVILDRYWWSTWVYGLAASVESPTLDALIQAERLHWRGIKPDALFLVDRSGDEFDSETRTPLRKGYRALSDNEKGQYPIHRIQNDSTVEDSLGQLLASLRDLTPFEQYAVIDLATPLPGPSDQLPLLPPPTEAPAAFTTLSPALPTVVYESYWRFAVERQELFFRKLEGLPAPWTTDAILAKHKFTNAYRASDRVSQYLIRHVIYEADQSTEELFFRTILFKLFRACPMKLGREVSRHNELDNWRNTHRFESVMATKWLLLTISETEPGLWDRLFNKIETWELLQNQLKTISHADYSFQEYDRVLAGALAAGTRIYSAAYMMPSAGARSATLRSIAII